MAIVMHQQLEQLQSLSDVRETTAKIQRVAKDQASRLDVQREAEYKQKVLSWISPTNPNHERHHAVQALRLDDTGGWLLQHPEFLAWRDKDDPDSVLPSTLWCHGSPGSGKTVLA